MMVLRAILPVACALLSSVCNAKVVHAQLRATEILTQCSADGWCRQSPYVPEVRVANAAGDTWLVVDERRLYRRASGSTLWHELRIGEASIVDVAGNVNDEAWILAPQCSGFDQWRRSCPRTRVYHWSKQGLTRFELEGHLRTIWVSGRGRVWVAGGDSKHDVRTPKSWTVADESRISSWDGRTWTQWPVHVSPQYQNGPLVRIWGTAEDDVWAIGGGTIQRWNGTQWQEMDYPTLGYLPKRGATNHSDCHFDRIWGARGDVWVGDEYCSTKHYDSRGQVQTERTGQLPEPQLPAGFDALEAPARHAYFAALSVPSAGNPWVEYPEGAYFFDGTAWHQSRRDSFGPQEMHIHTSIVANERGQALMFRENGPHFRDKVRVWQPWRKLQPANMDRLNLCALGLSANKTPLVASCQGSLYEWDFPFKRPLKLLARAAPAFIPTAIWSGAPHDVWVLSLGNKQPQIYRMDARGKRLLAMAEGLPETCWYRAIAGTASNDVWLVGADGCIAHFDGAKWTAVPSGFSERLNGVWAASRDHAWAVGVGGLLLEWDGRTWHQQQSDTHQNLHAISGTSEQDVWIVGEAGTILHRSGESR